MSSGEPPFTLGNQNGSQQPLFFFLFMIERKQYHPVGASATLVLRLLCLPC